MLCAVSADARRCVHSRRVGYRVASTALAPAGECLELRGRRGRRSDVAVRSPVHRRRGSR